MPDSHVLFNLSVLVFVVVVAAIIPFQLARKRVGKFGAFVGLAVGNLLGACGAMLYQSCTMLGHGYSLPQVADEYLGVHRGYSNSNWNWIAIAAISGMFLSF